MTAREESIVTAIWGPTKRLKSTKLYIPKQVVELNKDKFFYIPARGRSIKAKTWKD